MNKNYFSSDRQVSSRDNLSWTVSQFADRRQNQKNTSSADNLSLRSTVTPSLTAFLKTTYNKVAGQLLSRLTVAQPLTATQNIGRQILHRVRLAHLQPFFQGRIFLVGLQKSKPTAIKNSLTKILLNT